MQHNMGTMRCSLEFLTKDFMKMFKRHISKEDFMECLREILWKCLRELVDMANGGTEIPCMVHLAL